MAIFVTLLIALMSLYTLWLTIQVSQRLNKFSFKELAEESLGPRFGKYAGPIFEVNLLLI